MHEYCIEIQPIVLERDPTTSRRYYSKHGLRCTTSKHATMYASKAEDYHSICQKQRTIISCVKGRGLSFDVSKAPHHTSEMHMLTCRNPAEMKLQVTCSLSLPALCHRQHLMLNMLLIMHNTCSSFYARWRHNLQGKSLQAPFLSVLRGSTTYERCLAVVVVILEWPAWLLQEHRALQAGKGLL